MSAPPTNPSTRENHPTSVAERERFFSGGRPHLLMAGRRDSGEGQELSSCRGDREETIGLNTV